MNPIPCMANFIYAELVSQIIFRTHPSTHLVSDIFPFSVRIQVPGTAHIISCHIMHFIT